MPKIYISDNISISPDILLVYLTYLVLRFEIYYVLFFSFFLGLFQDFIINIDLIGLADFIKSICVYYFGFFKKTNLLWNIYFKIFFIFFIYLIHFIFYYLIAFYGQIYLLIIIGFLHSILNTVIFLIINRSFSNLKLL